MKKYREVGREGEGGGRRGGREGGKHNLKIILFLQRCTLNRARNNVHQATCRAKLFRAKNTRAL